MAVKTVLNPLIVQNSQKLSTVIKLSYFIKMYQIQLHYLFFEINWGQLENMFYALTVQFFLFHLQQL